MEELQPGVEKQDSIIWFEASADDLLIMIGFGLFLVDLRAFISQVPDLFKIRESEWNTSPWLI